MTTAEEELLESGKALPVMEDFYTIQGEGFHQGKAAYFIRTAGCDVGCHWCDVKESWDSEKHPLVSVDDLVNKVKPFASRTVVVTGGEPLMYNLAQLTKAFHYEGYKMNLETSGAWPLSGVWDWICFSPKKFKAPLPEIYPAAHELKVVVYNKSDLAWAEEHALKVEPHCRLFLQPEWSKQDEVLPFIIEYIKNNPRWQISLQIHKFMNIP